MSICLRDRCDPVIKNIDDYPKLNVSDYSTDASGLIRYFLDMSNTLINFNEQLMYKDIHKQ